MEGGRGEDTERKGEREREGGGGWETEEERARGLRVGERVRETESERSVPAACARAKRVASGDVPLYLTINSAVKVRASKARSRAVSGHPA